MKTTPSATPDWSDDDLRFLRVARGARTVAATVIVGGIAFAAIQTSPTSERPPSLEALPDTTPGYATSEPSTGVMPAEPTDKHGADPALRRVDPEWASRG